MTIPTQRCSDFREFGTFETFSLSANAGVDVASERFSEMQQTIVDYLHGVELVRRPRMGANRRRWTGRGSIMFALLLSLNSISAGPNS